MNKKETVKAFHGKLICAGALLLLLVCPVAAAEHLNPNSILRFASGAPGSGIHQQTGRIAASLWVNSPHHGSHLTLHQLGVATSSAGSASNLENLGEARVEFAVARADLTRAAHKNQGNFTLDVNTDRIRLVTHLAPALVHVLVRTDIAGSPRSIAELQHRSVSIGLPGNMAQQSLKALFAAHGVDWRTLQLRHFPLGDSHRRLVAGQIDAVVVIDQPDSPQLAELLQDPQNRLLALDPGITAKFIQQSPFGDDYRVEHTALQVNGQAIPTLAIDMLLLVQESVGPESVAQVLQNVKDLPVHQSAWRDDAANTQASDLHLKRHPGATNPAPVTVESGQAGDSR